MPAHLPAPDYGGMDPASARYLIRINGHLGVTLLAAFPNRAGPSAQPMVAFPNIQDPGALVGAAVKEAIAAAKRTAAF